MVESNGVQGERIPISFTLNGRPVSLEVEPRTDLLRALRDQLGLTGAKRSCDMQVCGACTVLVNGLPVSSCTLPAFEVRGAEVLTIEGLAPNEEELHPIMTAFVENAALQCGYCTPGMILAVKALLDETPHPSEAEVREYLEGNICRCTGYKKIIEAVLEAAEAHGR